jgi:ferrochelatase
MRFPSPESSVGILLVNTGTPDAPTRDAVVRYLRRFLSDRRIVDLHPLLWKPILNGIVLRVRPQKTVKMYRYVRTPQGSPYMLHSEAIAQGLEQAFAEKGIVRVSVCAAHRYGNPSMEYVLRDFRQQGVERLVILPLYPQQAFPTTHSVHDELLRLLALLQYNPDMDFIWDYFDDEGWMQAVADSIRPHLASDAAEASKTHLLFSFHSELRKDLRAGDPYARQVETGVQRIAAALNLPENRFSLAYQSRFGAARRWLGPFLHPHIEQLKAQGIERLCVVCPGFAVDCTETLYEIDLRLRTELQRDFPGERFDYIPCLNESPAHIRALMHIIERYL